LKGKRSMSGEGMKTRDSNRIALASLLVAIGLCMALASPAAAQERVFDPLLSLTGDCSTSSIDPIPDPGLCPIPPGELGVDHPDSGPFSNPKAVATDFYGNIYVASF